LRRDELRVGVPTDEVCLGSGLSIAEAVRQSQAESPPFLEAI
jgi:hypothetical protein